VDTINSILPLLILLSPLVGFFINGVVLPLKYKGFAKTGPDTAGGIATAFIAFSFVMGLFAFSKLFQGDNPAVVHYAFQWFDFGGLKIPFELRIDKLSGLLVLIITGIASHEDDKHSHREEESGQELQQDFVIHGYALIKLSLRKDNRADYCHKESKRDDFEGNIKLSKE